MCRMSAFHHHHHPRILICRRVPPICLSTQRKSGVMMRTTSAEARRARAQTPSKTFRRPTMRILRLSRYARVDWRYGPCAAAPDAPAEASDATAKRSAIPRGAVCSSPECPMSLRVSRHSNRRRYLISPSATPPMRADLRLRPDISFFCPWFAILRVSPRLAFIISYLFIPHMRDAHSMPSSRPSCRRRAIVPRRGCYAPERDMFEQRRDDICERWRQHLPDSVTAFE